MDYARKIFEDFRIRLNELAQMRKPRVGGSTLSHLGSQGYSQNAIPSSYRAPGPARAANGSALSTWKPRNGQALIPGTGPSGGGGKLYKPRKPASIQTKAGPIMRIFNAST